MGDLHSKASGDLGGGGAAAGGCGGGGAAGCRGWVFGGRGGRRGARAVKEGCKSLKMCLRCCYSLLMMAV